MSIVVEKLPVLNSLQSVIFDMDGVIIDSHPSHRKAWNDFLLTMGKNVSAQELDFVLDGRKRHEILRHFLGDISNAELEEYGRKKDQFFQRIALEVTPQPGVLDFISNLRREGVSLALATSAGISRTSSTLKRLCLTESFPVVVTGDDVLEGKPDAAIYRLACARLNSSPNRCVAIEDAESGIRAAKGAGLKCVGFASSESGAGLRLAGADHIISNFCYLSISYLQALINGKVRSS